MSARPRKNPHKDPKRPAFHSPSCSANSEKVSPSSEALPSGQTLIHKERTGISSRKAFATLSPTVCQYLAASSSRFSSPESKLALSPNLRRIVSWLHPKSIHKVSSPITLHGSPEKERRFESNRVPKAMSSAQANRETTSQPARFPSVIRESRRSEKRLAQPNPQHSFWVLASLRPVRLVRSRTQGFHPCNRGSNPLRDANFIPLSIGASRLSRVRGASDYDL